MKIKGNLEVVQQALTRAAEAHPIDEEVKLAREIAAGDILERIEGTGRKSFDPLGTARRIWDGRDRDTIPGIATQMLSGANDAEVQAFLKSANPEDFEHLVDAFATHLLENEAGPEALSSVLDFKAMCGASSRSAREYNRRLRGTPSYLRAGATPIDEKTLGALETLHGALEKRINNPQWEPAVLLTHALTETMRDLSSIVPEGAFDAFGEVAGTGKAVIFGGLSAARKALGLKKPDKGADDDKAKEKKAPNWIQKRAEELRDLVIPQSVQVKSKELVGNATELLDGMSKIEDETHNEQLLVDTFAHALGLLSFGVDPQASGIALGTTSETSLVLAGGKGRELLYNRENGTLEVSRTRTVGVRPAGGFIERAYASNYFGDGDAVDAAKGRSGLEAGLLCAQVGLFSGNDRADEKASRGWSTMISLGANLGVPGDLFAFRTRTTPLNKFALNDAQKAKIEDALAKAGDGEGLPATMRSMIKSRD